MLHEVLIDRNNTGIFETLIPKMYLEDLKEQKIFGVATFDGKITRDRLVGVVLVRVRFQWQEIVWVALTEKYSMCEYGADIIKNRVEDARDIGYLLGTYSEFPKEEILRREYFSCAGFSFEKMHSHTFSIYTHALRSSPASLTDEEASHMFSLRYLTIDQKRKMQREAHARKNPTPLEDPIDWDSYDQDASVLYEENGEVTAAILVCKKEEFYSMESFFGDDLGRFDLLFRYLQSISKTALAEKPLLLIPAITAEVEEILIPSPLTKRDELLLACLGYENIKKREDPTNEFLKEYVKFSEQYLLGLEEMEVCTSMERMDVPVDGQGSLEYSNDAIREKEAVAERHWKKMESWCQRVGMPPIMIILLELAKKGYKLYKAGQLKATELKNLGFTIRPLITFEERERMTVQFAGLILTASEMKDELEKRTPKTMYDRAKYAVDSRIMNILHEVTEAFFSQTGVNIYTGEKIPAEDRVSCCFLARVLMSQFQRVYMNYDEMITEEMVHEAEKEEGFDKALQEAVKERVGKNASSPGKEPRIEQALKEKQSILEQLLTIEARIELLCEREEFAGREQWVRNLYFSKIRSLRFFLDSVEGYIKYLTDGTPMKAMQGIYIRKKLDKTIPGPAANVRLDRQIRQMEPRFNALAPWELDDATILLGWERMLYRTGEKKDEGAFDREPSLEQCREMLKNLEEKKALYPELYRELMLTNMFDEIPEMIELFDEARIMRDAAGRLLDAGLKDLDEKYEIYRKALAIYDTLLTRARHLLVAGRMTMNELLELNPDFHTTDYEYCYAESLRISNER